MRGGSGTQGKRYKEYMSYKRSLSEGKELRGYTRSGDKVLRVPCQLQYRRCVGMVNQDWDIESGQPRLRSKKGPNEKQVPGSGNR